MQTAILLHAAKPKAQDIHLAFTWAENEDRKSYKTVQEKFSAHCEPKKNVVFER